MILLLDFYRLEKYGVPNFYCSQLYRVLTSEMHL